MLAKAVTQQVNLQMSGLFLVRGGIGNNLVKIG